MALRTAASRLGSLLVQDGAASQIRGVATLKVPDLPYDFGALEPFVSGKARGDRCAAGAAAACIDKESACHAPARLDAIALRCVCGA